MYCGIRETPEGRFRGTPSACFKKGIGVGYSIARGQLERGGRRAQEPPPPPPPPPAPAPPVQPSLPPEVILGLKRKGYSVNQSVGKFIVRKGSGDNRKVFGGRQDTAQEGWMVALKDSLK